MEQPKEAEQQEVHRRGPGPELTSGERSVPHWSRPKVLKGLPLWPLLRDGVQVEAQRARARIPSLLTRRGQGYESPAIGALTGETVGAAVAAGEIATVGTVASVEEAPGRALCATTQALSAQAGSTLSETDRRS